MEDETKKIETEDLTGFNWDEEDEFFAPPAAKAPESKEKAPEEDPEDPKAPEKKAEEEPEDDFFEDSKKAEPDSLEISWKDTAKAYKETGLFKHVSFEEEDEIDEDKFFELQEEEYNAEVAARLQAWADKDLDEDARAFIKFKTQGGKTKDFFDVYINESDIPEGDISDEDFQDTVIRVQLKSEGWDAEEIEDRLEYLTKNGKKEKVAQRYNEKFEAEAKAAKEALLAQEETNKKAAKAQEEAYKKSVKDTLEKEPALNGLKITQKDKTELLAFLTTKNFKVDENRSITGFQKKLAEVFQTPEKLVILAKLINSDFDFSQIEKNVTTKKVEKIKKDIEQRRGVRPSSVKNLADLF